MKTLLLLASLVAACDPALAASQCADMCRQELSVPRILLSRVDAPAQDADSARVFDEARQKKNVRRKFRLPLRLPFGLIN